MIPRLKVPGSVIICLIFIAFQGCATYRQPYTGVNAANPQFERGLPFLPLDFLGDFLSKPYQLLFWTKDYGNHSISAETEKRLAEFIEYHQLTDVKVRMNQWAPHKEIGRLFTNKQIAWPYKIFYFPSTLIASLLGRPLGGLLLSDYYDPGSNTINLVSNQLAIALHEGGHAKDFADQKYKGTYGMLRILPGINIFQEAVASDEALEYLENHEHYDDLLAAYHVLYPAYATYVFSYISASPFSMLGAFGIGHIIGASHSYDKREELIDKGYIRPVVISDSSLHIE